MLRLAIFRQRRFCKTWYNSTSQFSNSSIIRKEKLASVFMASDRKYEFKIRPVNLAPRFRRSFIFRWAQNFCHAPRLGYSTHSRTVTFCHFFPIFEKIRPQTLLNPKIFPDCYIFLTFFCNSPTVLKISNIYFLHVIEDEI